jgi:hypothetical protein
MTVTDLANTGDFEVADATYRAAVARWPAARITQMLIAKSYSRVFQKALIARFSRAEQPASAAGRWC